MAESSTITVRGATDTLKIDKDAWVFGWPQDYPIDGEMTVYGYVAVCRKPPHRVITGHVIAENEAEAMFLIGRNETGVQDIGGWEVKLTKEASFVPEDN